jgi:hypothetical protein
MCAAGVCPNELQGSASSDNCDHMPIGHSDGPEKNAPEHHGCSMHPHPTANIVRTNNLPRLQLTSMGCINANDLLANSTQAAALAAFSSSDLASPHILRSSLRRQISPLRI